LIVLYLIARTASRRELAILKDQLSPEVAAGVLTLHEYEQLTNEPMRRAALRKANSRSRSLLQKQRAFFQTAAELAFRKYHLSRGEKPKPGQESPEDVYRVQLAELRDELSKTTG
jgi:hypothetical protein